MQVGRSGVVARHQVLLLDDDEDMLDLMQLALSARGLQAAGFTHPSDLFAALDKGEPSIVMTDLHLDPYDGLAVCRRVAQDHPHVLLVVLSGDGAMHERALRAGADLFLTKPIEPQALGDTLVALLTPPRMAWAEGGLE